MKQFFYICFLILTTVSCNYFSVQEKEKSSSEIIAIVNTEKLFKEDIKEILPKEISSEDSLVFVKNYINALQNGNVEAMNALLADDAMVYGLGGGKDSLNVAQHKEYYTNSTAQYIHSISRDLYLPVKVNNNWNEGEWILCWGTNTVTDKKSGKQIPIPYHTANKIDNGKIVKVYYYYDM